MWYKTAAMVVENSIYSKLSISYSTCSTSHYDIKSVKAYGFYLGLLSFARQLAYLPAMNQGHILYFPWDRSSWILYCCGTLCFIKSLWLYSQSACTWVLSKGELQRSWNDFFFLPSQGSWRFTRVMRSCMMKGTHFSWNRVFLQINI